MAKLFGFVGLIAVLTWVWAPPSSFGTIQDEGGMGLKQEGIAPGETPKNPGEKQDPPADPNSKEKQDTLSLEFRFQEVKLSYSDKGAPMGLPPRVPQESAFELENAAPAGLKLPQFKTEKQFYGILTFVGQQWNFVIDGDEKGKGALHLDRNQNKDLTDDGPAYLCEWENSAFAGNISVSYKPEGAVLSRSYRMYLITTVNMQGYEKRKPIAAYYATCHWAGTLKLGGEGSPAMACYLYDNPADGRLDNDPLYVDLNANGATEEQEVFSPGEFKRVGNFLVAVNKMNGRDLTVEFVSAPLGKDADRLAFQDVLLEMGKLPIVGNMAPDFKLKDLAGADLSLSGLRGKVVLVDFWATWCGPCKVEMPNVIKMYDGLKDKDFQIVGISLDNTVEDLKKYVEENKIAWPQIYEGKGWQNTLVPLYRVEGIPATFLLDRKGVIRAVNLRGEDLVKKVNELLEKKD